MPAIRPARPDDAAACAAIIRELPDYFTPDVPDKVATLVTTHPTWVAHDDDDRVLGLAVVELRPPGAAEILWLAVTPAHRNSGIGTLLVDRVFGDLAPDGLRLMEAKTLDHSAGYEPYVATRAFWEARGFVQIDTIDPLPGWDPGNPAAIYVAAVTSTR